MKTDRTHIASRNVIAFKALGARVTDECHTGSTFGTVNVTAMWEDIAGGTAKAKLLTCLLDHRALRGIENKDLNAAVLKNMTSERAIKPIIGISRADGTTSIVDGNHRMAFRAARGDKTFVAWIFDEAAIEDYKVDHYLAPTEAGPWRLLDAEEILGATVGRFPETNDPEYQRRYGGGDTQS